MNFDENKPELKKSDRIWLGVIGALFGLGSFIPFIFISWYLSDRFAELLNIDYGIDPPEELLIYIFCILPLIFLCAFFGIKSGVLFYKFNNKVPNHRYFGAFIGALLGGLLVSFVFSIFVVAFCFYT